MTDHLDVFQFSSKAAYALDLKNGNEDGATCGGYLNSSLAQGRIMSNVPGDFWRHHSESGSRIQGHFDESFGCGSFNFYIERDDSLFQNCFWWGWLRHSKMLLHTLWGSDLLSKQSVLAFYNSWIWHRFHHDEDCVPEDVPSREWCYSHQPCIEQLRAIPDETVCELYRFLELSSSSPLPSGELLLRCSLMSNIEGYQAPHNYETAYYKQTGQSTSTCLIVNLIFPLLKHINLTNSLIDCQRVLSFEADQIVAILDRFWILDFGFGNADCGKCAVLGGEKRRRSGS